MIKKLGYYTCAGMEFESKIQAMVHAATVKKEIVWHFNDDVFDKHTWSDEPESTLDQLYDQRARQIREEYDYVILSFSGGADSFNVLESFLRQGLLIDEIITNWSLDISEKFLVYDKAERSPWNNNAEFKLNTVDKLEYIRNVSPRTKITILDTSKTLIDGLLTADDASWTQSKKEVLNANGANTFNYIYFDDIRKRFDKFQKIALLFGCDKPNCNIIDDKLYLQFRDKIANIVSVQDHIAEYPNATPLFFYWDPDSLDILCKQAHTILKWINANQQYKKAWEINDPVVSRRIREELLKTIIYTTWNTSWFQVTKALKEWDSEFDYWFSKGWAGTREHDIWADGLKHIISIIPEFLTFESNGKILGLRAYTGKLHFIGNIQ